LLIAGGGCLGRAYGFAGGTGEPNNPYQIATAADLLSIGSDPNLLKKSFVLVNDINLDPNHVFDGPLIAPDQVASVNGHGGNWFSGVLDGQGHTIRNLRVSGKSGYDAGLFGMLSGLVKDLHLENVQVSGSPCGGLVGDNTGTILRCSVNGQVTGSGTNGGLVGSAHGGMILHCTVAGTVKGSSNVGGLMGEALDAAILNCESAADVSGSSFVGGMVGFAENGTRLVECRATGSVTGGDTTGGLVGQGMQTTLLRCIATGLVTGTDHVGGLVGEAWGVSILNCESQSTITAGSYVGGLAGFSLDGTQVIESRAGGFVTAGQFVGGLVGHSQQTTLLRSSAACQIVATGAAGGLAGDTPGGEVSILDCHAGGSVTGAVIGGLIGDAGLGSGVDVLNSFAACGMLGASNGTKPPVVGGLFGNRSAANPGFVVAGCFWDTDLSKVSLSAGSTSTSYGTGLTTQQMQQPDPFQKAGWDFNSVWAMPASGYPILQWELAKDAK
jgi:hypothetical protein